MQRGGFAWYGVLLHGLLVVFSALVLLLATENRRLEAAQVEQVASRLSLGDVIPPVQVRELGGGDSELRFDDGGRDTVAMVFTTTCSVCEDNLSHWVDLYQRLGSDHDFVAIGLDDPQAVQAFVTENALPFRVVTPENRAELAQGYGIKGVPKTILVGPDGRVKKFQVGRLKGW